MTLGTVGTIISAPGSLGTVTRPTIRRAICRELHMPFMRRMKNGYSTATASSTPTLTFTDSSLAQEDDYWNGQWWYNVTNDEVRKVIDFRADTDTIRLEYAATAIDTNDVYEIHSIWNAYELHDVINRAIEDAYPSFFDVVTDETIILKEEVLEYSLASLTYSPWIMTKIWIENPDSVIRGTATASGATSLTDSSANFTGVDTNWKISIYAGTGAGQLRDVSSLTGTTQINVSAWTTTPDTTSKYALWDTSTQTYDWTKLQDVRFNGKENPTKLYLPSVYYSHSGVRLRLEYIAKPITMTTEASVTSVPKEFLIHRALYFLFSQKINDNRADRARYEALAQRHFEQSELYRQAHAFNMPEATMWTPQISQRFQGSLDGDPIGWRGFN